MKTLNLNPAASSGFIKIEGPYFPDDDPPRPPNPKPPPTPRPPPAPKPAPKPKPQWSATAKAQLKGIGMTDQGIAALQSGKACANPKDQAIVSAIIAAILP